MLAYALTGRRSATHGGFEKVVQMIDEMVGNLKKEQDDDDHKKEYCSMQFDLTDDKMKALKRHIGMKESAIASNKDAIATLSQEIASLSAGIAALDKAVAEAT